MTIVRPQILFPFFPFSLTPKSVAVARINYIIIVYIYVLQKERKCVQITLTFRKRQCLLFFSFIIVKGTKTKTSWASTFTAQYNRTWREKNCNFFSYTAKLHLCQKWFCFPVRKKWKFLFYLAAKLAGLAMAIFVCRSESYLNGNDFWLFS